MERIACFEFYDYNLYFLPTRKMRFEEGPGNILRPEF
jgi:hypothetical protein